MNRRKPPVLLFSLLIVLVGVFFVFGMRHGGDTKPDPKTLGDQATNVPSDDELHKQIATASQNKGETNPKAMMTPSEVGGPVSASSGPSIAMPKQLYAPKNPNQGAPDPNGSVRSQWYGK